MKNNKVAWVVPFPIKGSGGHRTIFNNINYLTKKGFDSTVFIQNEYDGEKLKNGKIIKKRIKEFYGECDAKFIPGWNIVGKFDIIFATGWETVRIVKNSNTNAKKCYFIQDFEAYFHPMGDGYLFAENTYKYGLKPITIGRWLSNKMQNDFNTPSSYFDFCADKKIYKNLNLKREPNSVCFIFQPEKPRRCPILGIESLEILKYIKPETKIYLYGSNEDTTIISGHKNLKIISPKECSKLYNKCSVGFCISSSNPSRIPFEMMACGLPVVEIYTENNLYDMPDKAVLLAEKKPECLASAINTIFENTKQQKEMSKAGLEYMKNKDLSRGYKQFAKFVIDLTKNNKYKKIKYQKIYNSEPFIGKSIDLSLIKRNTNPKNNSFLVFQFKKLIPKKIKKQIKNTYFVLLNFYKRNNIIYRIIKPIIPNKLRYKIKNIIN